MNCSGVPDTLLESELFGHLRGSFTGAMRDKPGLAKAADGGTLFLDEVGEMSLRMQAVVLRFVETGEIQQIGATTLGRVDVRLIAATNRDLRARIAQREFREDLYYRLNVIQVEVPPLRGRDNDVSLLLRYYLKLCGGMHAQPAPDVTAEAEAILRAYRWPGNVRELKNLAERLVVRQMGRTISVGDLPVEILSSISDPERAAVSTPLAPIAPPIADQAWNRMALGESFWTAVHSHFKTHDLTRADLRALITRGLESTRGNYRQLVELFGMDSSDYRRFMSFLYQYDCSLPFQPHRMAAAAPTAPAPEEDTVSV
jgi:transcriptional regulator with GAF, ATPase, and Fis domain